MVLTMESDRRDIYRSAKTGTVTRAAARNAVTAAKSSNASKSGFARTAATNGGSGFTSKPSAGSKRK